jgi:hypothetical protein
MADINLSPYTAEQQAMDRRRKMAEALQQQAIAPIEMPNVPGARVSPYQGLAKLLQGYIAGKNLRRADEEQKDYENKVSQETADLLSKMSQYETVPGDITSPAVPADITPAGTDIQENQARKNLIAYNLQNTKDGMRQIPINNAPNLATYEETYMPSSITDRIIKETEDLPFKTTQDVINKPAVPEERGPSRREPVLNASFLDSTKPNAYKTGQVKQLLAQYLMQQEAQKQAAAQAEAAAARQIHAFNPEQTAGRFVNGQFVPLVTGKPKELTDYQNYQLQLQNNANAIAAVNAQDKTGLTVSPEALQINPKIKGVPTFAKKTNRIDVKTKKPIYTFNGEDYIED